MYSAGILLAISKIIKVMKTHKLNSETLNSVFNKKKKMASSEICIT